MEQNNHEWFSPKGTYDWYAPNFPEGEGKITQPPVSPAYTPTPAPQQSEAAPETTSTPKKPRKKRTAMKVTMIVICVLILVAGTALAFSNGFENDWDFDYSISLPGFEFSSGDEDAPPSTQTDVPDDFMEDFGDIIPGIGGGEADMPEDFREFFDSYYTMEETIEPSSIQRAEVAGDFELELGSSVGKDKLTLQQLYSRLSPSVVGIMAYMEDGVSYGWGTGVIADAEGYIITNAHVLSEAVSCTVVLWNGRELEALLVGSDSETDLAVLKIQAKGLVPAAFGSSDELSVGDDVVAIGNPLGTDFSGTLTNGIVSAINRNVDYMGTDMDLIQTNAALNEGNSGGPLINMYGQVVGITNMKMVNNYGGATIEGIGFAIPSTTVKEIVDKLISGGEVRGRPSIGIVSGTVPEAAKEEYGLPDGLYITEVYEGSDAKAKGILPGDVLTHVNGEPVNTTDRVIEIRDQHEIGDSLTMTIFRDGESFEVDVEIYDSMDIYG